MPKIANVKNYNKTFILAYYNRIYNEHKNKTKITTSSRNMYPLMELFSRLVVSER